MLAIYTGQRKGDIRAMRWDHLTDDGCIMVEQEKGVRGKPRKVLHIPIHPNLAAALSRAPRNGLTILRRRDSQLFTESGLNAVWRRAK